MKIKIEPKENRRIVYSVLTDKIINDKQKNTYPTKFKVDTVEVAKARNECLAEMNDTDNLNAFIYVHSDGKIEKEINVLKPKYQFHPDYDKI
jgi:hypothetical protein